MKGKTAKKVNSSSSITKSYKILLSLIFLWGLPYAPSVLVKRSYEANTRYYTLFTAFINAVRTTMSIFTMCYSHLIFPNLVLAITFNAFIVFSLTSFWSLFLKRRSVLFAIKQMIAVTRQLRPEPYRSKWNVYFYLILNLVACTILFITAGITFLTVYEGINMTSVVILSYEVSEEHKDMFRFLLMLAAGVIFFKCVAACSLGVQLSSSLYYHLGDSVFFFKKMLQQKLEGQSLSQSSLSRVLLMFESIRKLNHTINEALSTAVLCLYGSTMSIFFTGLCAIRTYDSTLRELIVADAMLFAFALYCFLSLTITGSRIKRKYSDLKESVVSFTNLIITVNSNEKNMLSFSLMSKELCSADLHVTGGSMFVIDNSLIITTAGTLLTYSVILFQMN